MGGCGSLMGIGRGFRSEDGIRKGWWQWADGVLQAVLVLKYVVPNYPFPTLYFGIANVIANGLIMLR